MTDYSIWVLEYATSPRHPVSGVLYGRHNQGTMNLPFAYTLIKSRDTVAIVDVGYDARDFGGDSCLNRRYKLGRAEGGARRMWDYA